MALIECPECGKENVSDSAESCPCCGYPIKKYFMEQNIEDIDHQQNNKKLKHKLILIIIFAVVILSIISALHAYQKGSDNSNAELNINDKSDSLQTTEQVKMTSEEAINFATGFFGKVADENLTVTLDLEEYKFVNHDTELFGYLGKFQHGFTSIGGAKLTVDLVDWISNENNIELKKIIVSLSELYGEDYRIDSYEENSDSAYIWEREDKCSHIICWKDDNGIITIRWIYNLATQSSNTLLKENSTVDNKQFCIVTGCTQEGTIPVVGITNEIEYYCQKHFNEIEDFQDMMEEDVGNSRASKHSCLVDGCTKEGTNLINGFNGNEYYCTKHYNEMLSYMGTILGE